MTLKMKMRSSALGVLGLALALGGCQATAGDRFEEAREHLAEGDVEAAAEDFRAGYALLIPKGFAETPSRQLGGASPEPELARLTEAHYPQLGVPRDIEVLRERAERGEDAAMMMLGSRTDPLTPHVVGDMPQGVPADAEVAAGYYRSAAQTQGLLAEWGVRRLKALLAAHPEVAVPELDGPLFQRYDALYEAVEALSDPDRRQAAAALIVSEGDTMVTTLIRSLNDPERRAPAHAILVAITGEELPADGRADGPWQAWLSAQP